MRRKKKDQERIYVILLLLSMKTEKEEKVADPRASRFNIPTGYRNVENVIL